jgi:Tol biopolymer transport system component
MKKLIFIILIVTLFVPQLNALEFGKNKVKYQDIEWSVMKTTHFDIYFEKNLDSVGQISALIIEEAYYRLQDLFKYSLPERIPVVIYNSHNEFQQTNIVYQLIDEGTGGFTEFIKNRVVVPFDGSYKRFELTLNHELTHVFCYYALQGSSIENFASAVFFSLPLWLSEGIAEFCSVHDSDYNDMFMLDLVVNDEVMPLDEVYGYYAYREGESFLLFLESRFGTDSIIEFLYNFKIYKSLEESAKKTFGYSMQSLEDQWKIFLKRKYGKFICDKDSPIEEYERITHHKKGENSININPSFSLDGTDILYFSDKTFNMSIYKTSTLGLYESKKLVVSGGSGRFEDFHFMKNSISYFPDGKKFAFVTRTSNGDVISICSAKNGKELKRLKLDFDAIYELDASPKGDKIVFVGQKDAQNDLYVYHLKEKSISRLTDDQFDDRYPRWSPDGKRICFASERFVDKVWGKSDSCQTYIFSNLFYNIFIYDISSDSILAVTNDEFDHQYPIWSKDGNYLIFTSYQDHISNIYAYNLSNQGFAKLTNIFGGCFSPSITEQGDYFVFSAFYQKGWDLYLYSNPLDSLKYFTHSQLLETEPFTFAESFPIFDYKHYYKRRESPFPKKRIVYHSIYQSGKDSLESKPVPTVGAKKKKPEVEDYHLIFTPDLIFGGMGYSSGYGLSAQLWIALSDALGNHHIQIMTDVNRSIDESNIIINYYYLKKRIDYGIGFFNLVDNYYYYNFFRDEYWNLYDGLRKARNIGLQTLISYPIDKFNRFDFYNMYRYWKQEWFVWYDNDWHSLEDEEWGKETASIYTTSLFFIHDTALWGMTGPIKGSRISLGTEKSFGKHSDYLNFYGDLRKYLPFSTKYQFATRLELGSSGGKDKEKFILGGYYNLRGHIDYEYYGYNMAVGSLEFRFPFIESLRLGFPLPIWIRNIRGAAFTDVGGVWDRYKDFKAFDEGGLRDLKMGYGFGTRMNLGYFVLKFDWAWKAGHNVSKKPSFYFSLDTEF